MLSVATTAIPFNSGGDVSGALPAWGLAHPSNIELYSHNSPEVRQYLVISAT